MPESLDARQDFRLWWALVWTAQAIRRARTVELSHADLSFIGTGVLFATVGLGNRATPAEISHWLFREPNSVSALLSRMEKKGLIRKTNDLDRKNMVRVELTKKGEQAYNDAARGESIRRIMTSLSEKEQHHLISCLDKLRSRALEELGITKKFHWE